MDNKKGILGYLSEVFMIYGIAVLLLNIFCMLFGEEAKQLSTIFSLGGQGLSISTLLEFLLAIALVVTLRFIFMTDFVIRKMPLPIRIILLFTGALGIVLLFIFMFGWFPVSEPMAWLMFLISFGISCTISTIISTLAEKQENRKLEEALKRFKEEQ